MRTSGRRSLALGKLLNAVSEMLSVNRLDGTKARYTSGFKSIITTVPGCKDGLSDIERAGGRKASTYFPSYEKGFNSSAATPQERWEKARGVIVGTLPPVVVHQEAFAKLVDYQDILVRLSLPHYPLICTRNTFFSFSKKVGGGGVR
jgi:hypothetical protein